MKNEEYVDPVLEIAEELLRELETLVYKYERETSWEAVGCKRVIAKAKAIKEQRSIFSK